MADIDFNYPLSICCGSYYTICIDDDGNVWSFGKNDAGNTGNTIGEHTNIPKQIESLHNINSVSCGWFHSVCCDFDGNVYTFGSNSFSQLGRNKTQAELSSSNIPLKIDIPPCIKTTCGLHHTVCLTFDKTLWVFGYGSYGQLGLGNENNAIIPKQIPNLYGVEYIETGGYFSFCKTIEGTTYCWGQGAVGQLGIEIVENQLTPIACINTPENTVSIKCGCEHTLFLTEDGTVYGCGSNTYNQLGQKYVAKQRYVKPEIVLKLPPIRKIDCGYDFSMCIDTDNNLWTFGDNYYGQLGIKTNNSSDTSKAPNKHPYFNNIVDISHGGYHTFVKTINDEIYAFGRNENGQLGKLLKKENQPYMRVFENQKDMWLQQIKRSSKKSARK